MGVWLVALGTNQISYILKVSDAQREQQISMVKLKPHNFLSLPLSDLLLFHDEVWEWDARFHPLT